MFNNQKGVTTIELLISSTILLMITVSAFQFFETYQVRSSELGEYETAKVLAINGIENERLQIKKGDNKTGNVYQNEMFTNRTRFATSVTKEKVTKHFAFFNHDTPMYKLTSTVTWKNRELEVSTYVSSQ